MNLSFPGTRLLGEFSRRSQWLWRSLQHPLGEADPTQLLECSVGRVIPEGSPDALALF